MADTTPLLAWPTRTKAGRAPIPLRAGGREVAAVVGWGGLEVWDPDVDLLELCAVYARAVSDSSCGQCIPCREGSRALAELVEALRAGHGREDTIDRIRALAETISKASRCDIGKSSPPAVLATLDRLRDKPQATAAPRTSFVYESTTTAPCMQACPLHVDVPRYVEQIKNGRFEEALRTIQERLPFAGVVGRVCVKPCESSCRRGLLDDPIQIKHLKRFVADRARRLDGPAAGAVIPPASGAPVAVVGAGPSGLTCARVLAAHGHPVTVFERLPEPGGMLAVAIPAFRLPDDVLREETRAVEAMGVKVVYGSALGRDFTIGDLRRQGFRAVFIAVGTHKATRIDLGQEGATPGTWDCLDFLRRAKRGERIAVGDKVVVLGGGNVAIDAARTARRLGAGEVRIVYRRKRAEMPAHEWEIEEAVEEGISIEEGWAPHRIVAENGRLKGVEAKRSVTVVDESGRAQLRYDERQLRLFEGDTVVLAIGIGVDDSFQRGIEGLELRRNGTIKADPSTFRTNVDGVFAGGDCVTGPNIVVEACAHGLLAGVQIARYLATGKVEPLAEEVAAELLNQLEVYDLDERIALPGGVSRMAIRHEPPLERTRDFREVDGGFTEEEAMAEANRCLRCYRVVTCAYRA